MQESLQRIIISLVLPQFPWLQGFDIKVTNDRFYEVVYYPKSSYLDVFTVTPEFKEVEDMTKRERTRKIKFSADSPPNHQ